MAKPLDAQKGYLLNTNEQLQSTDSTSLQLFNMLNGRACYVLIPRLMCRHILNAL